MTRTALLLCLLLLASPAGATTYYVASNGADTNNGTTKTTPWEHLPGMVTCTNTCASTTPVAGDLFILKGGDSWTNANFPVTWMWSGSAGNVITIGVDQTWFTGDAWSRPVWTAGGTAISGTHNVFLNLKNSNFGVAYVTVDNLEMTGFFWTGAATYSQCGFIMGNFGNNLTLDHLYVHGWSHGTFEAGTRDDSCYIVLGDTNSPFAAGGVLQNSVIDGSDSTGGGDSLVVMYSFPSAKNNVLHDLPNFLLPIHSGEISGNLIYNCNASFDSGSHENFLETLQGSGTNGTFYIFNNVFHTSVAGCEAGFLGNPGEVDYVWNNVWYNIGGNGPALTQNVSPGKEVYFWNNVIVPPAGQYCLRARDNQNYDVIDLRNNHCITTASPPWDPLLTATAKTITPNTEQTPTAATAEGYTDSQTPYVYFPTTGGSTLGAGTNLTTTCSGDLAGLCTDTSYGSLAPSHTVTGVGRTARIRGTSGAWNAGPYDLPPSSALQGTATLGGAASLQ